jgi:hypothetical protein
MQMSVSNATAALKRHIRWAADHIEPLLQDPTPIVAAMEDCTYICPRLTRDGHVLVVLRHKAVDRGVKMYGKNNVILAFMVTILKALSRSKDPMAKVVILHDRRGTSNRREQLNLLKIINAHIFQHLPGPCCFL